MNEAELSELAEKAAQVTNNSVTDLLYWYIVSQHNTDDCADWLRGVMEDCEHAEALVPR